jgi:hypothetical protein
MEAEFENGLKNKVVDLVKMYNFGVLSFQSFNVKFKVVEFKNLNNTLEEEEGGSVGYSELREPLSCLLHQ